MSDYDQQPPDSSEYQCGSPPVIPGLPSDYSQGQSVAPPAPSSSAELSGSGTLSGESSSGSANVGGSSDGSSSYMDGVRDRADTLDLIGKGIDLFGLKSAARIPGLMSAPGDAIKTADGISDAAHGGGIKNALLNGIGFVGDVAAMTGHDTAADVASGAKGAGELSSGIDEMREGIHDHDADKEVTAVNDLLNGVGDTASAAPDEGAGHWVKYSGKALNFGMALGNKIAPDVFGEKSESPDVQSSDGQWHASTGNGLIDWMAGTGKYSSSRWHADGKTEKEIQEQVDQAEGQRILAANPDATMADLLDPEKVKAMKAQADGG